MNHTFDLSRGLIIARAELQGPAAEMGLSLALDTGASQTMINMLPLPLAGYLPAAATKHVEITTGSGVAYARRGWRCLASRPSGTSRQSSPCWRTRFR